MPRPNRLDSEPVEIKPFELATVAETAKYMRCCTKTVRRYVADGYLTGYRLGGRMLRIDLNEVDAMLRAIPTARDRSA